MAETKSAIAKECTPGSLEGKGKGNAGDIKVAVNVDQNSITGIEVLEQ